MRQLKVVSSNQRFASLSYTDFEPLIPEGKYHVAYTGHETCQKFKSPKAIFGFRILDFGDYNGTILNRYYNVDKFIGKPGKNGNFKPPKRGDFMLEFVRCFHVDPKRLDRLPLSYFSQNILLAQVVTVKRNSYGKTLPQALRYSRIGELLKVDNDFG